MLDDLGQGIESEKAAHLLTIVLESVFSNFNEYRDYNGTTTQSDRGEQLFVLPDFLRLRARYDRVCWNLKPVIWAHELMVREGEQGVAKLWRRSLAERVAAEAEKYELLLLQLQSTYSVQMSTVAERISEKFMLPLHVDRLKALVGPAMKNPGSRRAINSFELIEHEIRNLTNRTLGVGLDLPEWLNELETEVKQQQALEISGEGPARPPTLATWHRYRLAPPTIARRQSRRTRKGSRR